MESLSKSSDELINKPGKISHEDDIKGSSENSDNSDDSNTSIHSKNILTKSSLSDGADPG